MLLVIDNYDSFTFNLVHYLGELGADVHVYRNDKISIDEIEYLQPDLILISPGPCTPNEAGISMDVIREYSPTIPILGVCLGHQSIGKVFGGKVIRAKKVMHGKTSLIYHDGRGVYKGIPCPFEATRYHSLIVEKGTLPDCLEITAWTIKKNGEFDEIMGFRHKEYFTEGVQFHPESILTLNGIELLENFMLLSKSNNEIETQGKIRIAK
jgi:anthranilate synthase component II